MDPIRCEIANQITKAEHEAKMAREALYAVERESARHREAGTSAPAALLADMGRWHTELGLKERAVSQAWDALRKHDEMMTAAGMGTN